MSAHAIRVQDVAKQYQLGAAELAGRTLRDTLTDAVAAPFRRLRQLRGTSESQEMLWALRGVSFDVRHGEVVGIIGRNGAGKSTLLKVLSRITEPTLGRMEIRGRVASLLEVGTGFHPELTGRENIFLNGAILGMSRREIERNFDEIVAFAEVARFIDTPVKRYSSGMYLRLAFAVAAHLQPDILVVDEVLAVGNSSFQKKCVGKMQSVSREGRTVLFVSHNMAAVKSLCTRAILLKAGRVELDGAVEEVVESYFAQGADVGADGIIPADLPRLYSNGDAWLRAVQLTDLEGTATSQLFFGQPFRVTVECEVMKEIREAVFEIGVVASDGTHLTYSSTIDRGMPPVRLGPGRYQVSLDVHVHLLPRPYHFLAAIHHMDGTTCDWVERVHDFTVLNVAENSGDHYRWPTVRGYVRPEARWSAPVQVG